MAGLTFISNKTSILSGTVRLSVEIVKYDLSITECIKEWSSIIGIPSYLTLAILDTYSTTVAVKPLYVLNTWLMMPEL